MMCKYGDPICPCQDGDPCHYEGEDAMHVPPAYVLAAVAAEREACALQVRHDCTACEGTGYFPGSTDTATECEYCGRPMTAIRARAKAA